MIQRSVVEEASPGPVGGLIQGGMRRNFFVLRHAFCASQANVAQLVEQLTRNEQVSGSSPLIGSTVPTAQSAPPGYRRGAFLWLRVTLGKPQWVGDTGQPHQAVSQGRWLIQVT